MGLVTPARTRLGFGAVKGKGRVQGPLNKGKSKGKKEPMLLKRKLREFLEREN